MSAIRVVALGVLARPDGKLLLEKGGDAVKSEIFYRCLGGGIEFGEKGEQALVREFREEIGKEIAVEKFVGTVEEIFEYQGKAWHQIILFYECRFIHGEDYDMQHIPRIDELQGHTYWKSYEDIRAEGAILHPLSFVEILKELTARKAKKESNGAFNSENR